LHRVNVDFGIGRVAHGKYVGVDSGVDIKGEVIVSSGIRSKLLAVTLFAI
jgi:hypothetical protein